MFPVRSIHVKAIEYYDGIFQQCVRKGVIFRFHDVRKVQAQSVNEIDDVERTCFPVNKIISPAVNGDKVLHSASKRFLYGSRIRPIDRRFLGGGSRT